MSSAEAAVLATRTEFFTGAQLRLFDAFGKCFRTQDFTDEDIKASRVNVHFYQPTEVRAAVILTARGQTIPIVNTRRTCFVTGETYVVTFDRSVNDR